MRSPNKPPQLPAISTRARPTTEVVDTLGNGWGVRFTPYTVPVSYEPLPLPAHLTRPRLKTVEASEYLELRWGLRVAPSTLAKMRSVGGGPVYQKYSRFPLYTHQELDLWAETRLSGPRCSTSET